MTSNSMGEDGTSRLSPDSPLQDFLDFRVHCQQRATVCLAVMTSQVEWSEVSRVRDAVPIQRVVTLVLDLF
jgi:hypothetical protein